MLIYALVAGVLFGLYFSLVGIGLNLVFCVMRIVNLAHGDMLMLGAFIAVGVVGIFDDPGAKFRYQRVALDPKLDGSGGSVMKAVIQDEFREALKSQGVVEKFSQPLPVRRGRRR